MDGILIEYTYQGNEALWRHTIQAFIANIEGRDRLRGHFSYQVKKVGDDGRRLHIGMWDSEETLTHLQAQEFFKTFAEQIREFAGDSLQTTRFVHAHGTN